MEFHSITLLNNIDVLTDDYIVKVWIIRRVALPDFRRKKNTIPWTWYCSMRRFYLIKCYSHYFIILFNWFLILPSTYNCLQCSKIHATVFKNMLHLMTCCCMKRKLCVLRIQQVVCIKNPTMAHNRAKFKYLPKEHKISFTTFFVYSLLLFYVLHNKHFIVL
jgi:hypothetical protein